jgi:uncharacterized metal-binding protein YceD (DUF177 family)
MSDFGPWRHALAFSKLRDRETQIDIEAPEDARNAIAKFLGIPRIEALRASLTSHPWMDGVHLRGVLDARTILNCGLSLEEFEYTVREPLDLRLLPAGSRFAPPPPGSEIVIDLSADDPPDTFEGDGIELGALLTEQLALALPAFPRKPDAVFSVPDGGAPPSPFSVLATLKSSGRETS